MVLYETESISKFYNLITIILSLFICSIVLLSMYFLFKDKAYLYMVFPLALFLGIYLYLFQLEVEEEQLRNAVKEEIKKNWGKTLLEVILLGFIQLALCMLYQRIMRHEQKYIGLTIGLINVMGIYAYWPQTLINVIILMLFFGKNI